jgi:hypothetical protein
MNIAELRKTIARQLRQSQAHAGLSVALESFPSELVGRQVEGHVHTAWQQVEHMRLAAEDLIAYCQNYEYQARPWPSGYWPESPAPPLTEAWSVSHRRLLDATEAMAQMVEDQDIDLTAKVHSAEKEHHHTLRAALILLEHNGYHAGQLIALGRALNAWPAN